jgi:hypothetical protein
MTLGFIHGVPLEVPEIRVCRLLERVSKIVWWKSASAPQGLKPEVLRLFFGTTEVMP